MSFFSFLIVLILLVVDAALFFVSGCIFSGTKKAKELKEKFFSNEVKL